MERMRKEGAGASIKGAGEDGPQIDPQGRFKDGDRIEYKFEGAWHGGTVKHVLTPKESDARFDGTDDRAMVAPPPPPPKQDAGARGAKKSTAAVGAAVGEKYLSLMPAKDLR
jgi:hypothetical protein